MLLYAIATTATNVAPLTRNELQRGIVLVADRQLVDPNFAHTVVLLLEHGKAGTAGIVLNRPTPLEVRDAIPALREAPSTAAAVVYAGGPVALDAVHVLVAARRRPTGAQVLLRGLYVVDDAVVLSRLAADGEDAPRVRYYAGYAGWGTGQLEGEVDRGDWHLARLAAAEVVGEDVTGLWERLIADVSGTWATHERPPAPGLRTPILVRPAPPDAVCEGRHASRNGVASR